MEKKKISFMDLVNILTSKEMKNITGGSGTCCYWMPDTNSCACGLSILEAQFMAECKSGGSDCLGWWCCDSCGETGYGTSCW